MPSFRRVLEQVHEFWTTRRPDLIDAERSASSKRSRSRRRSASNEPLGGNLLVGAAAQILREPRPVHGGFGGAPKFPQAPVLEFMLRACRAVPGVRRRSSSRSARWRSAGIYDQIGGGFARYSVDETWTVPHFEKMLYDNAQLARMYTHAWQAYKDPLYKRIAIETLEYLMRDMRDEAVASTLRRTPTRKAKRASSTSGRYDEFIEIAPEAARLLRRHASTGTSKGDQHPRATASTHPPDDARRSSSSIASKRVRPGKDDKVLASWNGLAIAAFAEAGAAFGRADFIARRDAKRPTSSATRWSKKTASCTRYRAGHAQISGFLEDYAYLADGLLALWEATFETRWLDEARAAREARCRPLRRRRDGGFYRRRPTTLDRPAEGDHRVRRRRHRARSSRSSCNASRTSTTIGAIAKPAIDAMRLAHMYMEQARASRPDVALGARLLRVDPEGDRVHRPPGLHCSTW